MRTTDKSRVKTLHYTHLLRSASSEQPQAYTVLIEGRRGNTALEHSTQHIELHPLSAVGRAVVQFLHNNGLSASISRIRVRLTPQIPDSDD